ncbi:MAG: hypothetical protein OEZ02_12150, partial [Anaerolineae bacterium]|nr:hypothetical protein [Anaerolineae bacterium]
MDIPLADLMTAKPVHPWLRRINMAYVPGSSSPIVDEFASDLLDQFHKMGHTAQDIPDNNTNIIFTSATFGEPLSWRKAMLFTARRRFKLKNLPTIYSIIHATPQQFDEKINHFAQALEKETPNPDDFLFPGLSPISHRVLVEQGLRGGPILSLMRLLQAQSKCIRILLLVGEQKPERVYHFDLVGAYPYSEASEMGFYEDVVLRIVTTESTREITNHEVVGEKI